jgi:hypothetical protein
MLEMQFAARGLDQDQEMEEMTLQFARLPVMNSLLYLSDAQTYTPPEIDGIGAVWSTPSCVAVSCLPDCEGDTELTVGSGQELAQSGKLLFDGRLRTPSRKIIVTTVGDDIVLERSVPKYETRVRIWTNGHPGTDRVWIGLE